MARRDASGAGCGCLLFCLVGLPLAAFGVSLSALALAAPAVVPYLLVTDPVQFEQNRLEWLAVLVASPLVAFVMVGVASPGTGRLSGRGRRSAGRSSGRSPERGSGRSSGGSLAALRRHVLRVGVLLAATTLTALVMLLRGNDAKGPDAGAEMLAVFGSTAVAAFAVLVTIHLRDRWFPPGERAEPVTVETVRAAAAQADETLRQVRAENKRVSRLARVIEEQLLEAHAEMDFVSLCNLHYESVGCADGAYRHYSSAGSSLQAMSRILVGVRTTLTLQIVPPRNRVTGRRERPDRDALKAAASSLSESRQQLDVEVQRGLTLVRTLNANTSRLKHSIKDNCDERGRQWYQALEMRIEAARSRDQRSPRAAHQ